MAHHSEPVRHRLKQKSSEAKPAQASPRGLSPGFDPCTAPKPKEMIAAALQKPKARGSSLAEIRGARPERPRASVYCRKPRKRYSSKKPMARKPGIQTR